MMKKMKAMLCWEDTKPDLMQTRKLCLLASSLFTLAPQSRPQVPRFPGEITRRSCHPDAPPRPPRGTDISVLGNRGDSDLNLEQSTMRLPPSVHGALNGMKHAMARYHVFLSASDRSDAICNTSRQMQPAQERYNSLHLVRL
jgi:hypothetical protein